MVRKHNRRAAKAAFAIAFGVALVLGGAAAAPAAPDRGEATPVVVGAPSSTCSASSTSRRSSPRA